MNTAVPTRTLVLTERIGRVCRLAPADVAFLLAHHRAHLELVPAGPRHRYRLTPAGHVGVIVAPTCRLVIHPKIPLANIFYLLDPLAPAAAVTDAVTAAPGNEMLAFLAARLAQLLGERAAAGLHRGYVEQKAEGPFLQGRLDLAAQLREAPVRKDRLHCRHDDRTADVPCNQVPRATAEWLLASPLLPESVRDALRRGLQGFAGVRPLVPGPPALDRAPPGYQSLLDLCRLLLEGLQPGEQAGAMPAPAFLLDLERTFEQYVTRGLAAALPPGTVSEQATHTVSRPVAGQPDVTMRPDLTVDRAGQPVVVVDAKWKRLPGAAVVTADLYQVLAYATALGAPRAVLVYPGRRARQWDYSFEHTPLRVTLHALKVVGTPQACARSLRRLAQMLHRESR